MTLQNRVLPTGEIVAEPFRGTLMGNRGCLHDAARRLGRARWRHRNWITCRLSFKGRRRTLMVPGRYTELFFLDEATALAVGHRPCAECRREDYLRFRAAWENAFGDRPSAAELDRTLHADRLDGVTGGGQRRHEVSARDLPDGAMALIEGRPMLVWAGALRPWHRDGYRAALALPRGAITVLTPAATLAVLRAGYSPIPHPSLENSAP